MALFDQVNLERNFMGEIEVRDRFGQVMGSAKALDIDSELSIPRFPSFQCKPNAFVTDRNMLKPSGPFGFGSGFVFIPRNL